MSATGRRVARSFATLAGGEFVSRGLAFVVSVRLARVLGADGFGALGFATAVLTYLQLLPNLGLDLFGTREVGRDATRAGELVEAALALRLFGALVAAVLLVPVALLLPVGDDVRIVVLLTGLSLVPYALTVRWLFLGLEQPTVPAVAATLGQSIVLAGVFTVVRERGDLLRVPLLQAAGELITATVLLLVARRRVGRFRPRFRLATWRAILGQSLPIALADIMRAIVFSFDVVLIGLWLRQAVLGQYVAAYRLVLLVVALGGFYYTALLPALSRAVQEAGPASAAPLVRLAARVALLLTAPVAVGGIVLAAPLLTTLYGADYAAAAPVFRLLVPSVAIIIVAGSCRNALIAGGRQQTDVRIVAAGAAVNVVLNLALIPLWGLIGAALATLAADGLILIWSWRVVAQWLGPLELRTTALVVLVAVALMIVVLLPLRAAPVVVSVPAGAAVYTLAVLLLDRQLPGQVRALLTGRDRNLVASPRQ